MSYTFIGSKRFQINGELIARFSRTATLIWMPTILLILNEWAQSGQINHTTIMASAVACGADFIRRFVSDYSRTSTAIV